MPRKLCIGFIGCGNHAAHSLYPCLAFAPVELVAICDQSEDRLEAIGKRYGVPNRYRSVGQLLEHRDLEAVLICGPPELHHQAAIKALDAGLHVFMEKPPANDLAGALEVQRAARANGRQCMVGFMKRFARRYQQAKDIMATPEFGATTQVTVKYSHWNTPDLHWMLIYMSVHAFDLLRFFAGNLTRVTLEKRETRGQFTFGLLAAAESGAVAHLITSAQEPNVKEHVEVAGESGLVIVRNVVELEYHKRLGQGHGPRLGDIEVVRPDFAIPAPEYNTLFLQGYAGEIIHFATAILEGKAPSVTIDDGVTAMRFVEFFEQAPPHATIDLSDWR